MNKEPQYPALMGTRARLAPCNGEHGGRIFLTMAQKIILNNEGCNIQTHLNANGKCYIGMWQDGCDILNDGQTIELDAEDLKCFLRLLKDVQKEMGDGA